MYMREQSGANGILGRDARIVARMGRGSPILLQCEPRGPIAMLCRQCGATFSQGDSFCAACGHDLGATALLTALDEHAKRPALDIVRDALRGDYDVKEQIGRGGMGLVFRAMEKSLKRQVALKVLPFPHVHDDGLVQRFTNEARIAARLEHSNIVPVYRVGRSGDVIYFTMRYLRGPSLAELIVETGTMAPDDIRRILKECAEALGYAHQHGVVHRDVKPDNVMFKESGEVVVCDFGIARAASGGNLTGTGMAIGTPYYMSPEQFRAKPLDGRSDIYSLGVVAYQCITKDLPFAGEDSFAIGYKHVTEPLPNPPLKTEAHRALFKIVARMMAKEPSDRYPDTNALIKDLSTGASTDRTFTSRSTAVTVVDAMPAVSAVPRVAAMPIKTTPTTPIPRAGISGGLRRPRRRQQSKSGIGPAAMAVLLLGGVGGGGYLYIQDAGGLGPALLQTRESVKTGLARLPWLGDPPHPVNSIIDSSTTSTPNILSQELPTASSDVDDFSMTSDSLRTSTLAYFDSAGPILPTNSLILLGTDSAIEFSQQRTGVLLVEGGRRGSLRIDGEPRFGVRHELTEGAHRLSLVALGFATYNMEIIVTAGRVVRHHVQMVKTSHCDRPDENYNVLEECFDEQPVLTGEQNLFVPLDATVKTTPTLSAELAVLVRSDGVVGQVQITRPSDVQAFTVLAREFARGLRFGAARRRGQNVDAWTTLQFYPRQ